MEEHRRNPKMLDLFLRWEKGAADEDRPSSDLQAAVTAVIGDARLRDFGGLPLSIASSLAAMDVPLKHAEVALVSFFLWLARTKGQAPWSKPEALRRRWLRIAKRYRAIHSKDRVKRWRAERPLAYSASVKTSTNRRRAAANAVGASFSAAEWRATLRDHKGRCFDCGAKNGITVGHLVPLVHRVWGSNTIEFIVPQCERCNGRQFVAIHVEALRWGLIDFDPQARGISIYTPPGRGW